MLSSKFTMAHLCADAAFQAIPSDVWIYSVAAYLEPNEILPIRGVSSDFRELMTHDDVWLNKLTVLTMQYPVLAELDQGCGETAFAWYSRCSLAVGSGRSLAKRHVAGGYPFLELYGKVEGHEFTPYTELRFPIEQGLIVELIALKARAGCADPAFDATLLFSNIPAGVVVDGSFRYIEKRVTEEKRKVSADDLRNLPEVLGKLYGPRQPRELSESSPANERVEPQRRVLQREQLQGGPDERV